MKFIGDVPIGRVTTSFLAQAGHDVVRVADLLGEKATDAEIVALAVAEQRIILCFDLDFSAIVAARQEDWPSVIPSRPRRRSADYIPARLSEILPQVQAALGRGALVTVEETSVRVRLSPIVRRPDDAAPAGA